MAKFQKGVSGNPRGRPRGIAPQAKLRAAITKDIPEILEAMVTAAKAGDTTAAKLLLDRTVPTLKPTADLVAFQPGESLAETGKTILDGIATGQMSTDQGAALISALAGLSRVIEVDELARRIEALERGHTPREAATP